MPLLTAAWQGIGSDKPRTPALCSIHSSEDAGGLNGQIPDAGRGEKELP